MKLMQLISEIGLVIGKFPKFNTFEEIKEYCEESCPSDLSYMLRSCLFYWVTCSNKEHFVESVNDTLSKFPQLYKDKGNVAKMIVGLYVSRDPETNQWIVKLDGSEEEIYEYLFNKIFDKT